MKRHLLYILLALVAVTASAQTAPADTVALVKEIESAGHIKVSMPAALAERLTSDNHQATYENVENEEERPSNVRALSRVGYRVQVFDDNNVHTAKHEAENRRRQMESRFPELRVYLQFNSPYWRVKVGDFRTRSEADGALAAIKAAFPSLASQLRVVRDHININ